MELKELLIPRALYCEEETLSDYYGKFYAEPFERGFGVTLGNSLRRVLLSSIQGAAITSVQIEGVKHQFEDIEGIKEDVMHIILNLKQIAFRLEPGKTSTTIYLDVEGPGIVTAGDFQLNQSVSILNGDSPIATLMENSTLRLMATVQQGRGYVPSEEFKDPDAPIGFIPVDAAFSPVRNVKVAVENARVGQQTDYDRLILEVSTNGTVKPQDAISHAARILRDQFSLFVTMRDESAETSVDEEQAREEEAMQLMQEQLDKSIEELELSVRSYNCLEAAGIKTIRDLVQKTESEMLKYRNFGRKSLTEIKNILRGMNLSFNMTFDENGMPVPRD
jgi:DNA-directed RNA polymerase subunit alpha